MPKPVTYLYCRRTVGRQWLAVGVVTYGDENTCAARADMAFREVGLFGGVVREESRMLTQKNYAGRTQFPTQAKP